MNRLFSLTMVPRTNTLCSYVASSYADYASQSKLEQNRNVHSTFTRLGLSLVLVKPVSRQVGCYIFNYSRWVSASRSFTYFLSRFKLVLVIRSSIIRKLKGLFLDRFSSKYTRIN